LTLLLLLISHVAVGTVAYMLGGDRMRKNIEKELIKVLDEHKSQESQ
jgi:hypothetical protein